MTDVIGLRSPGRVMSSLAGFSLREALATRFSLREALATRFSSKISSTRPLGSWAYGILYLVLDPGPGTPVLAHLVHPSWHTWYHHPGYTLPDMPLVTVLGAVLHVTGVKCVVGLYNESQLSSPTYGLSLTRTICLLAPFLVVHHRL